MKIKKGDNVLVVLGKDAGKTGKVVKAFQKKSSVIVEGVNQYKRHMKARSQSQPSEIITITKPLPIANVTLLDPKTKKPTRVGFKIEKGTKIRISRKSGEKI